MSKSWHLYYITKLHDDKKELWKNNFYGIDNDNLHRIHTHSLPLTIYIMEAKNTKWSITLWDSWKRISELKNLTKSDKKTNNIENVYMSMHGVMEQQENIENGKIWEEFKLPKKEKWVEKEEVKIGVRDCRSWVSLSTQRIEEWEERGRRNVGMRWV